MVLGGSRLRLSGLQFRRPAARARYKGSSHFIRRQGGLSVAQGAAPGADGVATPVRVQEPYTDMVLRLFLDIFTVRVLLHL